MPTYKYWFPTGGYHPVDDSISPEDATTRLREVFPEGFISKATPMDKEAMHQRAVDNQGIFSGLQRCNSASSISSVSLFDLLKKAAQANT